jgi:hypothetical protein
MQMKRVLKNVLRQQPHDISEFEARLEAALKPVKPPDQFVRELREKLVVQIQATHPGVRLSTKRFIMIILAGFLSLILVIVGGLRLLISLFGRIKLSDRFKRGGGKDLGGA